MAALSVMMTHDRGVVCTMPRKDRLICACADTCLCCILNIFDLPSRYSTYWSAGYLIHAFYKVTDGQLSMITTLTRLQTLSVSGLLMSLMHRPVMVQMTLLDCLQEDDSQP